MARESCAVPLNHMVKVRHVRSNQEGLSLNIEPATDLQIETSSAGTSVVCLRMNYFCAPNGLLLIIDLSCTLFAWTDVEWTHPRKHPHV